MAKMTNEVEETKVETIEDIIGLLDKCVRYDEAGWSNLNSLQLYRSVFNGKNPGNDTSTTYDVYASVRKLLVKYQQTRGEFQASAKNLADKLRAAYQKALENNCKNYRCAPADMLDALYDRDTRSNDFEALCQEIESLGGQEPCKLHQENKKKPEEKSQDPSLSDICPKDKTGVYIKPGDHVRLDGINIVTEVCGVAPNKVVCYDYFNLDLKLAKPEWCTVVSDDTESTAPESGVFIEALIKKLAEAIAD